MRLRACWTASTAEEPHPRFRDEHATVFGEHQLNGLSDARVAAEADASGVIERSVLLARSGLALGGRRGIAGSANEEGEGYEDQTCSGDKGTRLEPCRPHTLVGSEVTGLLVEVFSLCIPQRGSERRKNDDAASSPDGQGHPNSRPGRQQ